MGKTGLLRRALSLAVCAVYAYAPACYARQPAPAVPKPAKTKSAESRNLIGVLDLEPIAIEKSQAIAVSDRLREELFKSGKLTLVDRARFDTVLNEQALQQTGCTSTKCGVRAGKVLGVRKIVSGRVHRVGETQWLLTLTVTDVETARTVKTASDRYEGTFFALLDTGVVQLAERLTGTGATHVEHLVTATRPAEKAQFPPSAEKKKSFSVSWWVVGEVVVAGAAAAASNKSGWSG